MLGKIFSIICIIAVMFGAFSGNGEKLGIAILEGAGDAVKLTVSLCGMMGLWNGVMSVLERAGAVKKLSFLLRPFLKLFFPNTYKSGEGCEEICANVSANMMGIGNAATPMALAALKKMQDNNPDKTTATDDMITLAVLNTASLSLIPTTLITLRNAAGTSDPFSIVMPIWITSFASSLFALLLTRLCAVMFSGNMCAERRKRHKICKPS